MQWLSEHVTFTIFVLCLFFSFVLTVLAERRLIPILKSLKMGQKILDIGPRWHKSKEGTPTMGGLGFILPMAIVFIAAVVFLSFFHEIEGKSKLIITFVMAVLSGLIGVIDDRAKLRKKQNEGLRAWQKFFLQIVLSGGFLFALRMTGNITTEMRIPFTDISIELGILYYIISIILISGIMNSVNLNDGIDGLCSSITAVISAFFVVCGFVLANTGAVILGAVCMGGCLGFLVYNFYPARVFMGDTGSLFLGGLVVGMAYIIDNPLIVVVCGFMYILETLSVMMQVSYFKLTGGKRIFKMAPIHHHFEQCGWSEIKIVSVFSAVSALLCVISFFGI